MEPADADSQERLRILTYNLWCHLFVGGRDMCGRLQAFAAASAHYDVVAVQEVFRLFLFGRLAWHREAALLEEAMRANGFQLAETTGGPAFGQDAGLMIFSRRPIARSGSYTFHASDERPVTNKGYLYAEVGGVHVVNTHFDSRSHAAKLAQVAELVAFVSELPAGPVALVGDFNICQQHKWDRGELYEHLGESLRSVGLVDQASALDVITFESDRACYDHVFVRGADCAAFSVQDFKVSDHAGLAVGLELASTRSAECAKRVQIQ